MSEQLNRNKEIIEQAKQTYRQKRAQEEWDRLWARRDTIAKALARVLGIVVEEAEFDGDRVCVDGVHFTLAGWSSTEPLVILGECPRCHQPAPSQPIEYPDDFGRMLVDFRPLYTHVCPPQPDPVKESQADVARQALREWLEIE